MKPEPSRIVDVFLSLGLGLALHVVFQVAAIFAVDALSEDPYASIVVLVVAFVSQLLYMLPAAWIANRLGRGRLARYLVIQAGVLFLLGGSCATLFALN